MLDLASLRTRAAPVLAASPNVRAAFVFGSVARGRATERSDIDFAVVGEGIELLELGAALERTFRRKVDVVELSLESPIPLLRAVLGDGLLVYERSSGAAASFASLARSIVELDGPGYDLMMRAFMKRVARQGVGT